MTRPVAISIAILSLASAGVISVLLFGWPGLEPDQPASSPAVSPPAAITVEKEPFKASGNSVAPQTDRAPASDTAGREPAEPAPGSPVAAAASAVTAAIESLKPLGNPVSQRAGRSPAFDVARIEPTGEAVIAGHAAPGAIVELLRGAEVHDKTVADPSGDFVLVPKRLPAGSYNLALRAKGADGKVSTSADSVAVVLGSGNEDKPVVALVKPGEPAVVLSKPTSNTDVTLTIDAVEGEAGGRLYVSGQAAPGVSVRLYLNDAYIASAVASAQGRVAFAIQSGVKPGEYRVRLDQVDPSGKVRSRAEVLFTATAAVARSAPSDTPVPKPGNTQATAPADPKLAADHSVALSADNLARNLALSPSAAESRLKGPSAPTHAVASSPVPESALSETTPAPPVNTGVPTAQPSSPGVIEPAESPRVLAATPAPKATEMTDVVVVPGIDTTVVIRGDSLWRISRATYGNGLRYSVIYAANRGQIRDPDLIYPGQIFVLPKALQQE